MQELKVKIFPMATLSLLCSGQGLLEEQSVSWCKEDFLGAELRWSVRVGGTQCVVGAAGESWSGGLWCQQASCFPTSRIYLQITLSPF